MSQTDPLPFPTLAEMRARADQFHAVRFALFDHPDLMEEGLRLLAGEFGAELPPAFRLRASRLCCHAWLSLYLRGREFWPDEDAAADGLSALLDLVSQRRPPRIMRTELTARLRGCPAPS